MLWVPTPLGVVGQVAVPLATVGDEPPEHPVIGVPLSVKLTLPAVTVEVDETVAV